VAISYTIIEREMKRFYITAIQNAGKVGRVGWMVDYAVRDPERKGRWKRRQNMFLDRERAEDFLEEARREFLNTGRIDLAKDRLFHCDVLRAAKIMSDIVKIVQVGESRFCETNLRTQTAIATIYRCDRNKLILNIRF